MIPDNVEKIIMTKEDYDRNVEQLLVEKLELEQELQRKDNIIQEVKKYIRSFDTKIITQRELCILNDIALIIENHEDMVDRLKELENDN